MAKLLKLRRGTTSQHSSFTGAEGEVTVDTDKETLVVHDGSTAGGHPVAAEDMANVSSASIVGRLGTGSIVKAKLEADIIDGTKLADDACNSEHYTNGSIDHAHLSSDCIQSDNIADDQVNSEHIAAGAVDLEHMSSQSVDEDNLKISNAGSNGQYLQKQSGNTGGLTWATVDLTTLSASNLTSGTVAAARLDTATTQSAGNNSTKIATTAYADTAVSNLVDSSPAALNTLNELAAAIGDDANFSTTITNSLAGKLATNGNGSSVTNLNASALSSGTIPDARFPSTLPAVSGANLTGIESFVTGMILLWSGSSGSIPSGFVLCNGSNSTPDLRGRFVVGHHNTDGDYDVDDTGGSKTRTLSTSNLAAHTHGGGSHTHSGGSHTHSASSHTHSIGAHDHNVGNHSHSVGNHSHNVNNHTHSTPNHNHNMNSHTHSTNNTGNHSHGITVAGGYDGSNYPNAHSYRNRNYSNWDNNSYNTASAGGHSHNTNSGTSNTNASGSGNTGNSAPTTNNTGPGNTGNATATTSEQGAYNTGSAGGNTGAGSATTGSGSATTGSTGSGASFDIRPPYYALCYIMKT